MKKSFILPVAASILLGLALGYGVSAARHTESPQGGGGDSVSAEQSKFSTRSSQRQHITPEDVALNRMLRSAMESPPHSSDTIESILSADKFSEYERIALWMLDASEQDIAAYWEHHKATEPKNRVITDLVFINWTRLNPQAATAATRGTSYDEFSWWAWACHDPQKALAEAIANNPDRVPNVAWGIGEFHSAWLQAHFDEIPESGRDMAIKALVKWDDNPDPLGLLTFLKEHDALDYSDSIFKSLIRKDPWAAYDWMEENWGFNKSDRRTQEFIDLVSQNHPEILTRLADQVESLTLKTKLQQIVFEKLLAEDPEAALKQAKANPSPRARAQQLSELAKSFLYTSPDMAFEIAGEIMEPNLLANVVHYPTGKTVNDPEVDNDLMYSLLNRDPHRFMKLAIEKNSANLFEYTQSWIHRNKDECLSWFDQLSSPDAREKAGKAIVAKYNSDGAYEEALDLAVSVNGPTDSYCNFITDSIIRWAKSDSDGANEWLKKARLTEKQKDNLREVQKRGMLQQLKLSNAQ